MTAIPLVETATRRHLFSPNRHSARRDATTGNNAIAHSAAPAQRRDIHRKYCPVLVKQRSASGNGQSTYKTPAPAAAATNAIRRTAAGLGTVIAFVRGCSTLNP